jgi:ribosomal protein L40E
MSSWDCPKCNEVNPCSKSVCRSCGYHRFQTRPKIAAKTPRGERA